jgi:hypothetical protein
MEQAFPANANWISFCPHNLKLWGNWEMERWTDMNELELAKQLKNRYGFNV